MPEFYPTACQQTGSVLLQVGTQICPQLRLTTVLNHIHLSIPSNNPFPGAALLPDSTLTAVGEAALLLLLMLHNGMHQRHLVDPLMDGAEVVVVDGVDGAADRKWLPLQ
jgi:hypothetical protein